GLRRGAAKLKVRKEKEGESVPGLAGHERGGIQRGDRARGLCSPDALHRPLLRMGGGAAAGVDPRPGGGLRVARAVSPSAGETLPSRELSTPRRGRLLRPAPAVWLPGPCRGPP